jgi:hypothetical protein
VTTPKIPKIDLDIGPVPADPKNYPPEWGERGEKLMEGAYGMDGQPITYAQMVDLYERNRDARRVGRTDLPNGYSVSTVLLVFDHGFGDGPPVIFETMVFPERRGQEVCERYCTLDEARAGHAQVVAQVENWEPCPEGTGDGG